MAIDDDEMAALDPRDVLNAIADAEAEGFRVGEDLSVSTQP